MAMPKDPIMLLSYVNTQLRDGCPSPEALCRREDADLSQLVAALAAVGYEYDPGTNQFK